MESSWQAHNDDLNLNLPQISAAMSADGLVLGSVACENRMNVTFEDISGNLLAAVLSAEDKRFFSHKGIDWIAMLRALAKNIRSLRVVQGGSTITQQLVRNVIIRDASRTIARKVIEAYLARILERRLTKKQILECYLNAVYFGHGIYGVRLASLFYLSKEPEDLTIQDSAYLAGMLKGPSRFCQCCNPIRASNRTAFVQVRMAKNKFRFNQMVRPRMARRWRQRKTFLSTCPSTTPYFLDYVKQSMLHACGLHFPSKRLIVRTTLSTHCQEILEKVCRDIKQEGFGGKLACVVQDSSTGMVRALAGGTDYRHHPFNVATNGRVQPGSTIKPFVLAAAMESGIMPDKRYRSEPLEVNLPNNQTWNVRNYQTVYRGEISLAEALIHSDNSVFAQLILELGIETLSRLLTKVGFETKRISPAAAIGAITGGVSPLQICSSYSAFSTGGVFLNSSAIACVHNESGDLLLTNPETLRPALHPRTAQVIRAILREVVVRGTGSLALGHEGDRIQAKTGTTDEGSWYMSFDPAFRVLTWVESTEEQDEKIRDYPEKAVTARTLAQRIWALLKSASYGSPSLYGIFRGSARLSVRDLLWVEEQFA
jgi:membrane peptidoglycan carboxypeptidase